RKAKDDRGENSSGQAHDTAGRDRRYECLLALASSWTHDRPAHLRGRRIYASRPRPELTEPSAVADGAAACLRLRFPYIQFARARYGYVEVRLALFVLPAKADAEFANAHCRGVPTACGACAGRVRRGAQAASGPRA